MNEWMRYSPKKKKWRHFASLISELIPWEIFLLPKVPVLASANNVIALSKINRLLACISSKRIFLQMVFLFLFFGLREISLLADLWKRYLLRNWFSVTYGILCPYFVLLLFLTFDIYNNSTVHFRWHFQIFSASTKQNCFNLITR